MIYSLYFWKFIPAETPHSFLPPQTPSPLAATSLFSIWVWFHFVCFVFSILHVSEIIWYLFLSDLFHLAWYPYGIVVTNGKILFFFLWLNNILLCVCVCIYIYTYIYICTTSSLSIHLSMDLGCFHILAIVNMLQWT